MVRKTLHAADRSTRTLPLSSNHGRAELPLLLRGTCSSYISWDAASCNERDITWDEMQCWLRVRKAPVSGKKADVEARLAALLGCAAAATAV